MLLPRALAVTLGLMTCALGCAGGHVNDAGGSAGTTGGGLSWDGPSSQDFGRITLGTSPATATLGLHNGGSKSVNIVHLRLDGAAADDFHLPEPAPSSIAPGASVSFTVGFTPLAEGDRSATLTVELDGAATVSHPLHGEGACPTQTPVDLDNPAVRDACTVGLYVAVGNRSRRLVSTDLVTWQHDTLDHINCLANADGGLNCGYGGSGQTDPQKPRYDCSHKDPATCTVTGDSLDCSYTVPDPTTTDPTHTAVNCGGFDDGAFKAAFGKGLIVTASDFGIFTSFNGGASWQKAAPPAPQQWGQGAHVTSVAFGDGRFVVFDGRRAFTSTDGTTWAMTQVNLGGGYYGFGDFVFGNGKFVASYLDHETNVSADGATWQDVPSVKFRQVAFGNGVFVGVNTGLRASSSDGINWDIIQDVCTDPSTWTGPPEQCLGNGQGVAFDGNRFVACGTRCLTSTDGKTWSSMPGRAGRMDFGPAGFITVDWATNVVHASTDLVNWQSHPMPAGQRISRVNYGRVLKSYSP